MIRKIMDKWYQMTLRVYVWYTVKTWEVEEHMNEFVNGYLKWHR